MLFRSDMSYEYFCFFKKMIKKIVCLSSFTTISSIGFLKRLPESNKYNIVHNFSKELYLKYKDIKQINSPKKVITVLYIGIGRGDEYNKKLIDLFFKDKRFILKIVGSNNDSPFIKNYIKDKSNIIVKGYYSNEEKYNYIKEADVLCYNYLNSFVNDYALANKYYDGLIYKKPLLGNIKTYSGELINKCKVGISLDINDKNFTNKLFNYYEKFDRNIYLNNTERILKKILQEDELLDKKIEDFLKS